ncbi:MAG: YccF domain-containing protein [Thermodesulfobacteriota bacterium]|nr:YccF domain-containing protein [Desulfovibrio sp.]
MAPVNFLLNILWLVLGGFWMGVGWYLAGVVMFVTIIGIPWARSCFVIGNLAFWPFGKEAVNRELVTGREDLGTGGLGLIGNIVWFVLAGLWLAIGHVMCALANFITIIGIPFGFQHLKLAMLALAPVGKTVVDKVYD